MQVKQLKNNKLEREYAVTVPAADVEKQVENELQKLSHRVKIPGFRPGKIPSKVLKQRYGKSVMGEVLEKTVNQKTGEVLKDKNERPAMQPKIEIVKFDEGTDLEFKIAYEVLPELPKVDLAKVKVEKLTYELPESEVKEALERLSGMRKSYDAKAVTAKAAKGDAVRIDFKGFVDGEAFAGGEAKGHTLELGSGQFIPGFEDQLIGSKAGDDLKVKVAFPKDYHSADLKGKDAVFEVKVHEVLESKPVKVDDAFAKEMGMESLAKLKEAIRSQISRDYDAVARTKLKKSLFDELDGLCKFEAPKSMIEAEFAEIWKRIEEAKKQGDKSLDKPEKELRAEYEAIAERRVRLGLFLSEVGREHKLDITQEELSQAIMNHARQFPGQEKLVIEYYQKNPQHLEELRGPIIEDKAVDFILGKAKITEKKVSLDELMTDDDEPAPKKKAAAKKSSDKKDGKDETAAKKKPASKTKSTSKKKTA